jgi:glycosyltransferase involved in cell wall biosynthesis
VIRFSVVIPACNEGQSLPSLLAELAGVMDSLGDPYEVVVVDDGSVDDTLEVLDARRSADRRLRVIQLDGNYGQSTAFEAGFRAARGELIVTLDADGQNPPAEVPKLLAQIGPYDFVCGWRRERRDPWRKRVASKLANVVRWIALGDDLHDAGCSLKVMRRECVAGLMLFRGLHRFLPALVAMQGFRVAEVVVEHRPRLKGRSHYGVLNRLLVPLADLWTVRWMQRRYRRYRATERPAPKATR